jgi:hypothetical protein
VFSLVEPVTPNDNRLAPIGTEDRVLEQINQAINSDRKKTCDAANHSLTPPDIDLTEDEEKHGKLEAGGIEPRTQELEVALKQALTRLGEKGLVSCLVLLALHPCLVRIVEAWPRLSPIQRRQVLSDVVASSDDIPGKSVRDF